MAVSVPQKCLYVSDAIINHGVSPCGVLIATCGGFLFWFVLVFVFQTLTLGREDKAEAGGGHIHAPQLEKRA